MSQKRPPISKICASLIKDFRARYGDLIRADARFVMDRQLYSEFRDECQARQTPLGDGYADLSDGVPLVMFRIPVQEPVPDTDPEPVGITLESRDKSVTWTKE